VTLIYRGENILRGFDDDIRIHLRAEMEKEGVTILTGNTVSKVEKHGRNSPRICVMVPTSRRIR